MPNIEELIFIAESMALRGDNQETKDIGKITLAAIEDAERYKKDENGLLPCFKCGDKADVFACENSFTYEEGYHSMCVSSGCDAKGSWSNDWDMAVAFWNEERFIPAAVRAVLEEGEKE